MVQKSRTTKLALAILSRILLLIAAIMIGAFFFQITIHDLVTQTLGYHRPSGFFGFTFTDWIVSWEISASLLIGIILGSLGKKIDYNFIIIFFILVSIDFLSAENMTPLVYSGLVAATLIGNVIGFILKILRQKFLVRK